jgi:hypothetical protein
MAKESSENYYNKYRYLIWIDKKGFIELEKFSTEELVSFKKLLAAEIKERREKESLESIIDADDT